MAALGCDLDAAFAFLAEPARLGHGGCVDRLDWEFWEFGRANSAEFRWERSEFGWERREDDDAKTRPGAGPDPLEPYTQVPGAVGDIVDWITSTARRPNRVLALGAAIAVVGTLIGRRVAGPTRSATHLYVVTVAPATAGKDHPRRCILPLLEAARAGTHVHLGDITSQSGFNRAMKDSPLSIVVIDEIAGFLGRITSPKSSHWERRLSGKLREQWSCSFGAIGTMTAADYADTHIHVPGHEHLRHVNRRGVLVGAAGQRGRERLLQPLSRAQQQSPGARTGSARGSVQGTQGARRSARRALLLGRQAA